jgi:histidinol-phosphatase (PHP family)
VSWFNFHTHTNYCDGTDTPENYVFEALNQNMTAIGFSGHAPLSFKNEWCIEPEQLLDYCLHIDKLKREFEGQIQIYLALEADFIPGYTQEFKELQEHCKLDYIIGSVHLVKKAGASELWFIDGPEIGYEKGLKTVFGLNAREAVTNFYKQSIEMVETQKPDIIAHFDKVKMYNRGKYFDENEQWYKDLVLEILEVLKANNTIVEVNTRGLYRQKINKTYPDNWIIKKCNEMGIPLTLSSDAHKPIELTMHFKETVISLKELGIKELVTFENGQWVTVGFNQKGILSKVSSPS